MNKIEKWEKQLENIKKLSFSEAQKLYKKIVDMDDENEKKQAMNQLILGTLYVVPRYVKQDELLLSETSSYDLDDVINTMNEVWIEKVYNGDLLRVQGFSGLFQNKNSYSDKLVGSQKRTFLLNDFSNEALVKLFDVYVKFIKEKKTFSLRDMFHEAGLSYNKIPYFDLEESAYENELFNLFEGAYANLVAGKENNYNSSFVKKYDVNSQADLIIDAGKRDSFDDSMVIEDMESSIVWEKIRKEFDDELLDILDEKLYKVIALRFGFELAKPTTLQETRELLNESTVHRVRCLEDKALKKLRESEIVQKKYKGAY